MLFPYINTKDKAMKTIITQSKIVLLFVFILVGNKAFAQEWTWAKNASGASDDRSYGIDVDASGNSYITGFFSDTSTFGNTLLTSAGDHDIFIAKYDAYSNLLWAKKAGGLHSDDGYDIQSDNAGNCYVTGTFTGEVKFGENQTALTLTSNNSTPDIFFAKYNSNGSLVWVRQAGGGSNDIGKSISLDKTGHIYLTGYFGASAVFEKETLTNTGGIYDNDMFLAKYDTDGNFKWVRQGGGSYSDIGCSTSADNEGNVFVAGIFEGSAVFSGVTISGAGNTDIFIAKYNSSGNLVWIQQAGGAGFDGDAGCDISIDSKGNCYVTGNFNETASFGGAAKLISAGYYDIFVAKYNSNGTLGWAKSAGGPRSDMGCGIVVDASGNSFITGNYTGTAIFGNTSANNTLTSNSQDIFVARYDHMGNLIWTQSAGGKGNDYGTSISIDNSGNAYITGLFEGIATFGTMEKTSLKGTGYYDIFVSKIEENTTTGTKAIPANEEIKINIYPNPVSDYFTFETENEMKSLNIHVTSITGQSVASFNEQAVSKNYKKEVDMTSFPPGIYLVEVSTPEHNNVIKIIKQ